MRSIVGSTQDCYLARYIERHSMHIRTLHHSRPMKTKPIRRKPNPSIRQNHFPRSFDTITVALTFSL
jgi:hypothetical protein